MGTAIRLSETELIGLQTHPLRRRILTILRERPASGIEIAKALGEPRDSVAYHLRKLAGRYGGAAVLEAVDIPSDDRRQRIYQLVGGCLSTITTEDAARRLAEAHREVAAELPPDSPTRGLILRCAERWNAVISP